MNRGPSFLKGGFRPFFLGGALWALVVAGLWVAALSGSITLPTAFDPLAWHRHEMLFGYLGAVIAGFLLTAIPNWTGRLPVAGGRLAALAGLWLAARVAVLFSAYVGGIAAMVLDVGFVLALFAVAAREVIVARNRNLPMIAILLLFAIANGIDHAEALGLIADDGHGWKAGFALVLMLISLIGGRIIPSFTRNWLVKQGVTTGLPSQPDHFDKAALAATAAALLGWLVAPELVAAGLLLVAAGVLQAIRLARWSGVRTGREPIVVILHVAYAWLPLGLVLLGASILTPGIPRSVALHALSTGAMASMTLAVMTRAPPGHTARALRADAATIAIYVLVTLGAATRVGAPFLPFDYMRAIVLAGGPWGGAFPPVGLVYRPELLNGPAGRPGPPRPVRKGCGPASWSSPQRDRPLRCGR